MTAAMRWHDQAACRGADPDLFFPVGPAGSVPRQADEAKRSAGAARCKPGAWPGRWTTGSPMACGEAPRRTSAAPAGACSEE